MASQSADPLGKFLIGLVSIPAKIVGAVWGVLATLTGKVWGRLPWYARYLLFPIAGLVLAAEFIAGFIDAVAG